MGGRVYEPSEGMGKLVYEQPGNEVDGSCHSKDGSKYVEEDRKGSKGEQRGAKGNMSCNNACLVRVYSGMLEVIE